MDKKVEKCIFIGHKDGINGYKHWNLVNMKTIYTKDVVFGEPKEVPK
jgi:hypothetical protein